MMPVTWPLPKRETMYVAKPLPGPHKVEFSIPLKLVLQKMLKLASTGREAKKLLASNNVLIDGIRRFDARFPVGLMDVLTIKEIGKHWRMLMNSFGKLQLCPIQEKEASEKVCKVVGKTQMKGKKPQIHLFDGKNLAAAQSPCKVGDSMLISLPDVQVKKLLPLKKDAVVFLTSGKHRGEQGRIADILGDKVIFRDPQGKMVETLKSYVFVIGDHTPEITMPAM